jgi:GH24 family phage-related lysozyme (muramidase)
MTTKEQKQLTKEFERYLLGLKTKFTPKTIAKVLSGETSIESLNPKLAKSVGILKPIIPMLETPAEMPAETPQQPKAPNIKLTYQKAAKTRQQSTSDLVAKNIVQGQSVGSAIKSAFKEKTKARITGIKEAINPLNIAKKVTGGSSLGPALLGRMIGSSQEEIEYFSDKKKTKKGKKNRDPLFVNMLVTGVQNVRGRDGLADVFGKLYELIKSHTEEEKIHDELMHTNKKLAEDDEKKRHEEIIDILTNKTKKEKDEVKKIKEETEGKEKPTSKKAEKVSGKGKTAKKTTTPRGTKPKGATRNVKPKKTATPAVKPSTGVSAGRAIATVAVGAAAVGTTSAVIAKEEGAATKAYWDPKNQKKKVSIGYGHQIKDFEYKQGFIQVGNENIPIKGDRGIDTTITKEQAKKLLDIDIPKYEEAARAPLGDLWNKLNDSQKTALTSYAYNVGSTESLMNAGLGKTIQNGDTAAAAAIIRDKGVRTSSGKLDPGLVNRRAREAALFESKELKPSSETPKSVPKANEVGNKVDSGSVSVSDAKKQNNQSPGAVILNKQLTVINKPGTVTNNITKKDGVTGPALIQEQTGF